MTPGLDVDTASTLRQMVRYLKDDRKIARYLGITERQVRAARVHLPTGVRGRARKIEGRADLRDGITLGEVAAARQAATIGSERLLAALKLAMRGRSILLDGSAKKRAYERKPS